MRKFLRKSTFAAIFRLDLAVLHEPPFARPAI
jgi:hypothetical protein